MKKPRNPVELIIFDLGRVLVDFDFKKVIRGLKRHSPKTENEIRHYFSTTRLWDLFERGRVTPPAFFKSLQKELQLKDLDFKTFKPLWNDIFQEKKETIEILRRLRGRYRLAMISNVNRMHWEHVKSQHAFMKWFDFPIASYAVGMRKPELDIFHLALRKARVHPTRAIFIDDLVSHVRAARSLGIHGHHFKTAKKLQADLNGVLK